jgi:uncharacterized protein (DUF486 family)
MRTILLLTISNIFMTFAWYGHLKYRKLALCKVVVASWASRYLNIASRFPRAASVRTNSAPHS